MFWCGLPFCCAILALSYAFRELEARSFHVAPRLEANAIRDALRAVGLREVPKPEDATVVWTNEFPPDAGLRKRRVSTLPDLASATARADSSCRALMQATRLMEAASMASAATTDASADIDASPLDAPRATTCFVLPSQAEELRAAMVSLDSGRALWELEPADAAAVRSLERRSTPPPSLWNNPDALPTTGAWAARRHEPAPLRLRGRRAAVQLFVLVSGLEPLRAYVHREAVVWRALHADGPQMAPELANAARHRASPRRLAASAVRAAADAAGSPPLHERELWPIDTLWRALERNETGRATTPPEARTPSSVWRSLERVASLAALATLRAAGSGDGGGGSGRDANFGAQYGFSSSFALLSVHVSLNDALVPSVVSVESLAELPLGLPHQPAWHENAMRRVASDVLNLTGAALHPARRDIFSEMRSQLRRALAARKTRAGGGAGGGRGRRRAGGKGGDERGHRGGGGGGGGGRRRGGGSRPRSSSGGGGGGGGWLSLLGWLRPATSDDDAAPPKACKYVLPVARQVGEPLLCVSADDIDALTQTDVEWLWRSGFRRILPGDDDDLRRSLRPQQASDELLARYLGRWPKAEGAYESSVGGIELAEALDVDEHEARGAEQAGDL
jgi:hypothetical protein